MTIAALGTSLTARGSWVEALPAALAGLIHRPVNAVNVGRAGATSREGLDRVDQAAQSRPDVVLIEFASNDAALHRGISLCESAANLVDIVDRLRTTDSRIRPYLMTMSPAIGWRSLLRRRLARYYDIYPQLASLHRLGYIDNRVAWNALPQATLRKALPDGIHPIPEFAIKITLASVVAALARDYSAPSSHGS